MKTERIYKWSNWVLFPGLILTGILYVVYYDAMVMYFNRYGYPTYLIYPLAVLKIMGSLVILFVKSHWLREIVYAGFFYNFVLAFFAHAMVGEIDPFPTIFLALLLMSYFTGKKLGRNSRL